MKDTSGGQDFLKVLGQRRVNDEVALSDLTYSLMSVSSVFRLAFCEFFEVHLKEPQAWSIEREYPLGGNLRVDLAITNTLGETYLIENKINDRNYHFKEYEESSAGLKAKGLWLIAGHTVTETVPPRWTVRSWSDLVEHLEQSTFAEDEDLIRNFEAYVKGACQMAPIKEIRLEDTALASLFYLNNLFDRIITSFQNPAAKCQLYSRSTWNFDNSNAGKYFTLSINESKTLLYPWLGLTFAEEPCIGIWFDKDTGWGRPVHVHPGLRVGDKSYYQIYWEPRGTWFELKSVHYKTFMTSNRTQQAQILSAFFSEVVDTVVSALKKKA